MENSNTMVANEQQIMSNNRLSTPEPQFHNRIDMTSKHLDDVSLGGTSEVIIPGVKIQYEEEEEETPRCWRPHWGRQARIGGYLAASVISLYIAVFWLIYGSRLDEKPRLFMSSVFILITIAAAVTLFSARRLVDIFTAQRAARLGTVPNSPYCSSPRSPRRSLSAARERAVSFGGRSRSRSATADRIVVSAL